MSRPPHVKICGLTLPEHAEAAAGAGAAFIGLMFAEQSRRRVTVEAARRITAGLPPRRFAVAETLPLSEGELWFDRCAAALDALIARGRPLIVGVFADQPVTLINSIADAADLDLIQLSGNEPWDTCLALRRPTIKKLRAGDGATVATFTATMEAGAASLCMLDADVPGRLGGTGVQADWQVAATLAARMPLMLAGGLTPENVAAAIAQVQPWAVDVSSGVERNAVKDVDLIRTFVAAAHGPHTSTEEHTPIHQHADT